MLVPSLVLLSDVVGALVKMSLPGHLRVGDRVSLKFTLRRKNGQRTEELSVDGDFRVREVRFDAKSSRQVLAVEAAQKAPAWRAIKNVSTARRLAPTHFPPTEVR
jgi:hypothetical protein